MSAANVTVPPEAPLAAGDALRIIRAAGDLAVIITNQSGIGRGYFTMADVEAVHRRMIELLRAEGAELDDIRICPHTPQEMCPCRKPRPQLVDKRLFHGPVLP